MTTPSHEPPPRMTWTTRLLIAAIVITFAWLNYRVAVK